MSSRKVGLNKLIQSLNPVARAHFSINIIGAGINLRATVLILGLDEEILVKIPH